MATSAPSGAATTASPPPTPLSTAPSSSPSGTPATSPRSPPPSLVDGAKTVRAQDLLHVHEMPCAREALLFGLGAGFAAGGLHFVLRTTVRRGAGGSKAGAGRLSATAWRSMNWFVGAWAVGSVGAFHFYQRRREMERAGIGRAVEIMERKKREKEEEMRVARDAVRRRRMLAEADERRRRTWWGLGRWLLPAVTAHDAAEPAAADAALEKLGAEARGEDAVADHTPAEREGRVVLEGKSGGGA